MMKHCQVPQLVNTRTERGSMTVKETVLIVGGGGAGLTASMLLSTYGIESLVLVTA
jgi:heterodisulfide reductase subunit A-like polyferredoxin